MVANRNKESVLSNAIRRDSESVNEYDADEFEKEDLVQMAEPQKPTVVRQKGRNPEHKIHEKATNDSSTRAGASDNNSLMREISIRNNKQTSGETGPNSHVSHIPQLKAVNRPKGLIRDTSKDTLVVSAREGVAHKNEGLSSIPSNNNLHSQRS